MAIEIKQLASADYIERQNAARLLAMRGPSARPALPALVQALDKVLPVANQECIWIVRALVGMGPDVAPEIIPALIRMMESRAGAPDDQCGNVPAGSIGEIGAAAAPPTIELLAGTHAETALEMLRNIGPVALPAVIARLSDPERARALGAFLTVLGRAAAPAIPAWIATFEAGNVSREQFLEIIGTMGDGVDAGARAKVDAALKKRPV